MFRFSSLEGLGARVAAMSEKADGDCRVERDESGIKESDDRSSFCHSLGLSDNEVHYIQLVHGVEIVTASTSPKEGARQKADGLIGGPGSTPMGITTADCVPLLLYDPVTQSGGLIHAGREGTLGNIAGRSVMALAKAYNVLATDIRAVVGPSAGPCCYEVSVPMADAFREQGLPAQGRMLDLWQANVGQLVVAGVPRENVEVSGVCTLCGTSFHSHRVHANGQRNVVILVL